jgi:CheY-like chemotaxis protein
MTNTHPSQPRRIVAVLDSDPDTTEMLKTMLEFAGMVAATGSLIDFRLGKADLMEFLTRTKPDVILYDLGVPYEANYHFLTKAREDPAFPQCPIVLTTTNARAVEALVGVHALEIVGKPYDLNALVEAVRTATWRESLTTTPAARDAEGRRGGRGDTAGGADATVDGRDRPVH